MSTRITKTSTVPYDLIVGLTQGYFNEQLGRLFVENQTAIGHLTAKTREGSIDAILDPPRVEFEVGDSQYIGVLFYICFKSGKLVLERIDPIVPSKFFSLHGDTSGQS